MIWESREWVGTGGLVIGLLLGATIHRSNFCMMGAVADYAISGETRRLRAWMLAIAVAVVASQAAHLGGLIDLSDTVYRSTSLPWLSLLLGGVLFGFGMVIACGCASRSLVALGSGDLRALVALLCMAVAGYATMRGLLAYPRIWLADTTTIDLARLGLRGQGLPEIAARGTAPGGLLTLLASLLVAVPLTVYALGDRALLRHDRRLLAGSVVIGCCIAAGWLVTGLLGADDFAPQPLASLRFVAPVAESLQYLMTHTGSSADFGIASVGGVVLGAFASSRLDGSFRLQAFEDIHDLGRYLVGGALMGVGGVFAMGCTVGQGLTGVATLSVGSLLALVAIMAGGLIGTRYLEQGTLAGVMRTALGRP